MKFPWSQAKEIFSALGSPTGSREIWEKWFLESWDYLGMAGLLKANNPLELTHVRLRILALQWLILDFESAVEGDDWGSDPDWGSWAEIAGIEAHCAAWISIDDPLAHKSIAKNWAERSDAVVEEDGNLFIEEDVSDNMHLQLLALAVLRQRDFVTDALINGFGGTMQMFASLYAPRSDTFDLIWDRREELGKELDDLEERLKHCSNAADMARIRASIQRTQKDLEDDSLHDFIIDKLRLSSAGDAVLIGNDVSRERLQGYQWCESWCPVVNHGTPPLEINDCED